MIRLRPFIAVLLSLLLPGAQQVAFAHLVGHLGHAGTVAATVAIADQGDDGHGEALSLSHACTTCAGASGLLAAVPPGVPPRLTFAGAFAAPVPAATVAANAPAAAAYLARAPPAPL